MLDTRDFIFRSNVDSTAIAIAFPRHLFFESFWKQSTFQSISGCWKSQGNKKKYNEIMYIYIYIYLICAYIG